MLTTLVLLLTLIPFWLLAMIAAIVCAIAGWTVWRFRKATVALGFACLWLLSSIGVLGYLVVRFFTPYSPIAGVRLGVEAYWLTQPNDRQEIVRRNIQRDAGLRDCEYLLFGWNANDTFYYQSQCDNQRYFFTPTVMYSAEPISEISTDLFNGVCPDVEWRDYFEGQPPRLFSYSRDCQYAAVVSDRQSGPRDVLVIALH